MLGKEYFSEKPIEYCQLSLYVIKYLELKGHQSGHLICLLLVKFSSFIAKAYSYHCSYFILFLMLCVFLFMCLTYQDNLEKIIFITQQPHYILVNSVSIKKGQAFLDFDPVEP
jgi:hypothetical protein